MFCLKCWKTTETINKFEEEKEEKDMIVKYLYGTCKECNGNKYDRIGNVRKKRDSYELLF